MPLAIRNARRRVGDTSGFDADAAAYIRAVQDADGAALEPAVAQAINAFVLGCKADGIWSAIKASCILMGARTLTGALTPLTGSAPTNNNFVSGDYNRKTGLKGNAVNKNIDTGRLGSADGQNDKHVSVYASEAATMASAFPVYIGQNITSGNDTVIFRQTNDLSVRFNSSTGNTISGKGAATGFIGASRAASASFTFRASGGDSTVTRTSGTPAGGNMFVFTNIPSNSSVQSDPRLAFYSVGSSLTLSDLDTRVSDLYTAIGNAIA